MRENTRSLTVDNLMGLTETVEAPHNLTVGRLGDMVVSGDDPQMHRVLLHLWWGASGWMLSNAGQRISVAVEPLQTHSFCRLSLGPRSSFSLGGGEYAVVFSTGMRVYELRVSTGRAGQPPFLPATGLGELTQGNLQPNYEQLQLLLELAAPLVERPGETSVAVPTVKELAASLRWTEKKVNSKIDYLARKLGAVDVPGLVSRGGLLPSRRLALAQFARENYRNW